MERVFLRENPEEQFIRIVEKQKIGIVGMSEGAGATLVATALAKVLSYSDKRKVTLLEISDNLSRKKSLIYDAIGIEKRFKTREFIRFYSRVRHGESIKGESNIDEHINWGLITPDDIKEETNLTPIEILRLINNISGDLIICDIAGCNNKEDYLLDMDIVVMVIDPMPSRMISGYPFIREVKRLEYKGKKVIWLINKYNRGVNKRELLSFLKLKKYAKIPFIGADNFYNAEFNCRIPFEVPDIQSGVREPICNITVML